MNNNLQKIFQINLQHNYFKMTGANMGIEIALSPSGLPFNIQTQKTPNGYLFYTDTTNQNEQQSILIFPIKTNDPDFFNYTKLNIQANKILYLSNQVGSNINAHDGKWLDVQTAQFSYPLADTKSADISEINLIPPFGENHSLAIPQDSEQLYLDLSGKPQGKYQLHLTLNNQETPKVYDFFYYQQLPSTSFPMVLEWKGNLNTLPANDLTLSFEARSVYVKYFFLGIEEQDWESVKISGRDANGQAIEFSKSTDPETINGQQAFTAISKQPIPFSDRPDYRISFNSDTSEIQLPHPSPAHIQPIKPHEKTTDYRSDIYVHL